MKKVFAVFMLVLALAPVVAGATLIDVTVHGPSLEGNLLGISSDRAVSIYLPPSYDRQTDRRYPTLYVLHGVYDSNTTWTQPWKNDNHPGYNTMQALMDAGIEAGLLREMIVVIPDNDEVSHYTDSPVRGNWEQFEAEDLVSYVDSHYRTIARAGARGITGHSMGGHGAIKLAMKHPDVFTVAYGMSPSLLGWGGDVSPDNPAFAEFAKVKTLDDLEDVNFYVQAIVAISQSFAPNPETPLLADLPFGVVNGRVVFTQPGADRWRSHMINYMLPDYVENLKKLRALRFDAGYDDQYSHIPLTSRELSKVLEEHGIEHTFEMYNGDHRNRLWGKEGRLYTEVLPYFSRLLE